MGNLLTASQLVEDTSIANRAMKVVFHRGLGASRRSRDPDAEKLVKEQLGDQGQIVTRKLFTNKNGPIFKRAQKANEMYIYHMRYTLPHGDDGSRLLPNAMYMAYVDQMGAYESQLQVMDAGILASYDGLVQQDIAERNTVLAGQGKGQTAGREDYPDLETMKRHLYVQWHIEPISTANDFRYMVDPFVVDRLENRLKEIEEQANTDLLLRAIEPMKRFVEKLSVPIGDKKARNQGEVFRDSLVGNLNELVEDLPKLNMNNDPRVSQLISGIQKVIRPFVLNPDPLREQPELRKTARDQMAELMKKFDDYGLGAR